MSPPDGIARFVWKPRLASSGQVHHHPSNKTPQHSTPKEPIDTHISCVPLLYWLPLVVECDCDNRQGPHLVVGPKALVSNLSPCLSPILPPFLAGVYQCSATIGLPRNTQMIEELIKISRVVLLVLICLPLITLKPPYLRAKPLYFLAQTVLPLV